MGFYPFATAAQQLAGQTIPGSLTLTGGLTISGGFAAGGMINLVNTTATPTSPDLIITSAAAGDKTLGIQVSGDTAPRTQFLSSAMQFGTGTGTFDAVLNRPSSGLVGQQIGSFDVSTAGQGLRVAEGSNAKQGTFTLAGAATTVVANTSVTANSRILMTTQALGTVTAASTLCVSARTAGTSFTVTPSQATDTSTIAYQIFEPG